MGFSSNNLRDGPPVVVAGLVGAAYVAWKVKSAADGVFARVEHIADHAVESVLIVQAATADSVKWVVLVTIWTTALAGVAYIVMYTHRQWKTLLRVCGKEPEANVETFAVSRSELVRHLRNPQGAEDLVNAVSVMGAGPSGCLRLAVGSQRNKGSTSYVVEVRLGEPRFLDSSISCDCLDHLSRGHGCKHMGAAMLFLCRSREAEVQDRGRSLATSGFAYSAMGGKGSKGGASRAQSSGALLRPRVSIQGDPSSGCVSGLREGLRDAARRWALKARNLPAPDAAVESSLPAGAPLRRLERAEVPSTPRVPGVAVERQMSVRFLAGASPHDEVVVLLKTPGLRQVFVVAYSFDVARVVEALCVVGPTCDVKVLMDAKQCAGRTKAQFQRAKQLETRGCVVRLASGIPCHEAYASRDRDDINVRRHARGLVHGKSVLCLYEDGHARCLIGSANWSDSTVANVEFGAVLSRPGPEFVTHWLTEVERGFTQGHDLSEVADGEGRLPSPSPPSESFGGARASGSFAGARGGGRRVGGMAISSKEVAELRAELRARRAASGAAP